jgi:hypothetical protein
MKTTKPGTTRFVLKRNERGLVMRTIAFSCVLFLICALPINAKMKYSANQTASQKDGTEKTCVLIARPVCAVTSRTMDDAWFAALCEAYYQVRLGSLKNVEVVPSESLYQLIPKYRDFSQEVAQKEYADLAARFHAA